MNYLKSKITIIIHTFIMFTIILLNVTLKKQCKYYLLQRSEYHCLLSSNIKLIRYNQQTRQSGIGQKLTIYHFKWD